MVNKTNLIILLVVLLLCVVFVETVLNIMNVFPIEQPVKIYEQHEILNHHFKPNFYGCMTSEDQIETCIQTNDMGLWEEDDYARIDNHILVVGDSYVFGAYGCQYNETYPKIIEKETGIKTINAGVPGYEIRNTKNMLKHLLLLLKPEHVLITFTTGNDIKGQSSPYKYDVKDGLLVNRDKNPSVLRKINYNFALYRGISQILTQHIFIKNNIEYDILNFYTSHAQQKYNEEIKQTQRDFIEMKWLCDDYNIKCTVNILPSEYQDYTRFKETYQKYDIPEDNIMWPQEHFIQFFKRNNIPYIDSTEVLLDESNYLKINGHWNKKGCYEAGKLVAEYLNI